MSIEIYNPNIEDRDSEEEIPSVMQQYLEENICVLKNTCLEDNHRWKNGSGSHDIACKKCQGHPWITVRYQCERCFEERCKNCLDRSEVIPKVDEKIVKLQDKIVTKKIEIFY